MAQIAASIREFGFTIPVLIVEADGILAGHRRLLAAIARCGDISILACRVHARGSLGYPAGPSVVAFMGAARAKARGQLTQG